MHTNDVHGKKILIIDDDQTLTETLSEKLTKEGAIVSRANDGDEGLEKILNEKPDLVVLDVFMPKKSGIAMLHELEEKDPNNKTPIVVLSDSNDTSNIANAIASNAVAYLVKSEHQLQKIVDLIKEKL